MQLSPLNEKKTTSVQKLKISVGHFMGFILCSHIATCTWLHLGTQIPLLSNSILQTIQLDLLVRKIIEGTFAIILLNFIAFGSELFYQYVHVLSFIHLTCKTYGQDTPRKLQPQPAMSAKGLLIKINLSDLHCNFRQTICTMPLLLIYKQQECVISKWLQPPEVCLDHLLLWIV